MTYTPISSLRICNSNTVAGVAVGRAVSKDPAVHLFTGGASPMMVFLTGDQAGRGYEAKRFRAIELVITEQVEFEVDSSSAEPAALVDQPVGGLIFSSSGKVGMVVKRKDGMGFDDTIKVFFDDPDPEEPDVGTQIYYTKWRAITRDGDEKTVLFESTTVARSR